MSCQGEIRLKPGNVVLWKRHEWTMVKAPWLTCYGILLHLQQASGRSTRKRLWLSADSMSEDEWRQLCLLLRHSLDFDDGMNR